MTRRQRQVLDVVEDLIEQNGYSPSLEEIGERLGLSSVATVHKHISHLVQKGYVQRAWNQNRSIELIDAGQGRGAIQLPLSGTIVYERTYYRSFASDGETVVALIEGSEATLKRLYRESSMVRLQPANAEMNSIVIPADKVRVQGVVVGVIRKY